MNQYTPVPFAEEGKSLEKRKKALSVIEDRLVNEQEFEDIQDLLEAFDFDYLFYQELTDDTSWLPDFNRPQPFSNKLACPKVKQEPVDGNAVVQKVFVPS